MVKEDWRLRLFVLAILAAYCGVLPALGWLLATVLSPEPMLVGPYLLMSPVLASGCILIVASFFQRSPSRNRLFSDPELEAQINEVASKVGAERYKVYPQLDDGKRRSNPLEVHADCIDVHMVVWNAFNVRERDFLVAHALTREAGLRHFLGNWLFVTVLALIGSIVASLNLWTILAIQSVGLTLVFLVARATEQRQVILADAKALQLTRDLPAARKYIGWHSGFYRKWHGDLAKRRLDALRHEAVKLGIG